MLRSYTVKKRLKAFEPRSKINLLVRTFCFTPLDLATNTEKNGFVTAAKLRATNKIFVAANKKFAAATKRFVDRTKLDC